MVSSKDINSTEEAAYAKAWVINQLGIFEREEASCVAEVYSNGPTAENECFDTGNGKVT